jgi:hypothetical protein
MSRTDDPQGTNVDWTLLERRRRQRRRGGGASGGGGMDAWQQSVENRLSQLDGHVLDLRTDIRGLRTEMGAHFRWLYGLLVLSFAAVLGVMARGFGWL